MMRQQHLLMIHGLMGSMDYFSPRSYLPGVNVHTPDMLGYGHNATAVARETIDLPAQADFIASLLSDQIREPAWVLGHSVGGAVAMLVAQRVPELVAGLISVEGNFTLNDAFWCKKIAATPPEEWAREYQVMAADPDGFLARGAIAANDQRLAWAKAILSNQAGATLHAMASSVVKETGASGYLDLVRNVLRRTPIHLMAGQRSAGEWDVPDWARTAAKNSHVIPHAGHLMMLEDPVGFCRTVKAVITDNL